jgi:DNA mismatch endonuclease (patch repair protein)
MALPLTPPPSSATRAMKGNRSRDTKPELALRRALFARGYRYRVASRISLPGRNVRPDLVFPRKRIAVFVDGCFWHGCPEHCRMPSDPTGYWHAKIARNKDRDATVDGLLAEAGWTVVRIWEHAAIDSAADLVAAAVGARKPLEL